MLLFFEDSPRKWTLRRRRRGEKGGLEDVPPDKWDSLTYPPLSSHDDEWPPVAERDMVFSGEHMVGAIFGTGDKTTTVYEEDGVTPYRFREGTRKGQIRELHNKMEERFVKNNKAAWPVKVDVTY